MFDQLQERIGYKFRNPGLLKPALAPKSGESGELEWRGDAVLYWIASVVLYNRKPHFSLKELNIRRILHVANSGLIVAAKRLNLCEFLQEARGVAANDIRPIECANVIEAILGAMFQDEATNQELFRFVETHVVCDEVWNELDPVLAAARHERNLREAALLETQGPHAEPEHLN